MNTDGMDRPFMVAAFFGTPTGGYHLLRMQQGANQEQAIALAVSAYYMDGGKMPLIAACVLQPTREALETALKMLDAIDAAQKTEEARVVSLVPAQETAPPEPEPPAS